jgi:uncharacterized protein YndB with AHSA1/START domain
VKVIARVFGVLVGVWVILILVGFLLPGRYDVRRSVVIAAPRGDIFPLVGDLRAWPRWAAWLARDPQAKVEYSPATTEVGAWSSWTSKTQGDGKVTITAVRAPGDFEYTFAFTDVGLVAQGSVVLQPAPGGTRVTMGMAGDLGRSPTRRWFGLFLNRLVGPDLEAGLSNLQRASGAPR